MSPFSLALSSVSEFVLVRITLMLATFVLLGSHSGKTLAQAQDNVALRKHPPIFEFVQWMPIFSIECQGTSAYYTYEVFAKKPTAAEKKQELESCITGNKAQQRGKLFTAIKYLEGKPSTTKALKELYLKWAASLDSLVPEYSESQAAHDKRVATHQQVVKAALDAMALELELEN